MPPLPEQALPLLPNVTHFSHSLAPGADQSVRMPPLVSQAPAAIPSLFTSSSAPGADQSVRLPPLASQALAALPVDFSSVSAQGANPSVRMPPQTAPVAVMLPLSLPQARPPFTLASASPLLIPPNALALEPHPESDPRRCGGRPLYTHTN